MDYSEKGQIFHDPHNKRWSRIKKTVTILLCLLFFLIIAFIVSIYLTPALNELSLSPVRHLKAIHYPATGKNPNDYINKINEPKLSFHHWQSSVKRIVSKLTGKNTKSEQPLTMGFLVNDDDASFR